MRYTLPDLSYDYGALEPYYAAEMLQLHHDTHHRAYVATANATLEKLDAARWSSDFGAVVGLEKTLAFSVSGHLLHSMFWSNLSPDGGDKPTGELADAVDEHLGSFDRMREQLTEATVTVQGVGWGALAWDSLGQRLVVEQIYDHQQNVVQGAVPLLVFDAWEHAYYLQYRAGRRDYVESLWQIVSWVDVESRFARARCLGLP